MFNHDNDTTLRMEIAKQNDVMIKCIGFQGEGEVDLHRRTPIRTGRKFSRRKMCGKENKAGVPLNSN